MRVTNRLPPFSVSLTFSLPLHFDIRSQIELKPKGMLKFPHAHMHSGVSKAAATLKRLDLTNSVCVCVCVCVREREQTRAWGSSNVGFTEEPPGCRLTEQRQDVM